MALQYSPTFLGGDLISTRIRTALILELRFGLYKSSTKLPSEIELANQFKVSRTVVRDALADLEREGFVERVRGIGTIVNRQVVDTNCRLDLKLEYFDLIRSLGETPSCDNVHLRREKADERISKHLQIPIGAPVVTCEKRILSNGFPVVYCIESIPELLFISDPWSLDWTQPVLYILRLNCGKDVIMELCSLNAINATETLGKLMKVPQGKALLLMEGRGCCKLGTPVVHTLEYLTDYFTFSILRKKI